MTYKKARNDSIITELFEGQLCNRIVCKSCGYESYTFDYFMDLLVPIPRKEYPFTGNIDLIECLKSYTAGYGMK